ncbi:M20 family metallo-hydrolase [Paracoccus sp. MBLB3053]|uniref:M20 family metallo-hydrolase n=1 Tax=Paracoccus aurantius TaxID=3073814 RepID=A0ABU2HVD0_9RHOB|nr:M20 family metallo-hydrolase [Paracoccus sp. MBLB3053]MDS9468480.1 M20 family metallo-hydrolase [Paracoccus sp. MBLB3053]
MITPRIDGAALLADLHRTAQIGATAEGGICRLTLSPEDAEVRAWLARQVKDLGGDLHLDRIGNMFAHFPGTDVDLAPLGFGSHLDTQPTGGRYDGILGVLAGLAAVRALQAAGRSTRHPLCLVNWTNEEGARFAPTMLGSGVHSGTYALEDMRAATDRSGTFLGDALDALQLAGATEPGETVLAAWLELHIEQGPVLERTGRRAAAVTGVQGLRWYELTLSGCSAHAGTTPREDRRDAFLEAARLALAVDKIAAEEGGLATFGEIAIPNASRNVVPGRVALSIDLRHVETAGLDQMEARLRDLVDAVRPGIKARLTPVFGNRPTKFAPEVIAAVEGAMSDEGLPAFSMVSGAGHDAVNLATITPTAMIFVPSRGGLSHNPAEFTADEDCVLGAQLLLNAVLRLDRGGALPQGAKRLTMSNPASPALAR